MKQLREILCKMPGRTSSQYPKKMRMFVVKDSSCRMRLSDEVEVVFRKDVIEYKTAS